MSESRTSTNFQIYKFEAQRKLVLEPFNISTSETVTEFVY